MPEVSLSRIDEIIEIKEDYFIVKPHPIHQPSDDIIIYPISNIAKIILLENFRNIESLKLMDL